MDLTQLACAIVLALFAASEAKWMQSCPDKKGILTFNNQCCPVAGPNIMYFQDHCKDYVTSVFFPIQANNKDKISDVFNACYFECAWNATGVMRDTKTISLQNMDDLLDQLYSFDTPILEAVRANAKKCALNIQDRIEEYQEVGTLFKTPSFRPRFNLACSWIPIVMTLCIQRELFLNCPSDRWISTPECTNLRNTQLECFPEHEKPNGVRLVEAVGDEEGKLHEKVGATSAESTKSQGVETQM